MSRAGTALAGRLLLVACAVLSLQGAALASSTAYLLDPERSAVTFRFTENGVPREGRFERFEGQGSFDPEAPGEARLELRVAAQSIELGNELVDRFAQSEEWFDSGSHPDIVFRLDRLEPVMEGRYIAEGELGMRGVSLGLSAPVRLVFGPGEVHATGVLRVDRTEYGLGMGASQAFVQIGREVAVAFDLIATPAR